jgi:uroporphyrinogen decarboxylase
MTKRELLMKVFTNQPVERVPVGFWRHFLKDEIEDGIKNPELIKDNIEGHRIFCRDFDPDMVKIMTDGFFRYPNDLFGNARTGRELKEVKSIGDSNPWIEKQVEFAKAIREVVGPDRMCFYTIFSPITIFRISQRESGGKKTLAEFVAEDVDAVAHAMTMVANDVCVLVHRVLAESKIDGIYFSTQDPHGGKLTEIQRQAIQIFQDMAILKTANEVSPYNILHICGYAGHRNDLSHFVDYPAQIINWAAIVEDVPLEEGKKIFKGKPVIAGFDNSAQGVLYQGTRAEIEAETDRLLKNAGTIGIVLGADCTIPRNTSLDHLRWVRDRAFLAH